MKIVTIIGARPQFIKASPVSRAIQKFNQKASGAQIQESIVHTGQHYDHNMSKIFFDELKIPEPHYNLGVGSGHHGQMTATMLKKIEKVLINELPDIVLVYGDTNSTLAGALAASKLYIPVAHVEAGLRSYNRQMPEEINRVLTDHVSSLLFCPTDTAVNNLQKEGIAEGVFNVGDVMFDSFLFNKKLALQKSSIVSELGVKPMGYCLATVHREENTTNEERLAGIFEAFNRLANPDCPFIIPLHPRTVNALNELGGQNLYGPHVRILEPVSYMDMVSLESNARVILTDSGGIQKEAYFARVPCVTLRDETEWVETVEAGWNVLGGTKPERITQCVHRASPGSNTLAYGGGRAADRIIRIICDHTTQI